jgi:hypothetical protein
MGANLNRILLFLLTILTNGSQPQQKPVPSPLSPDQWEPTSVKTCAFSHILINEGQTQ